MRSNLKVRTSSRISDALYYRLLALIYGEGMAHSAAVDQTMIELGADPTYGARLIVYDP